MSGERSLHNNSFLHFPPYSAPQNKVPETNNPAYLWMVEFNALAAYRITQTSQSYLLVGTKDHLILILQGLCPMAPVPVFL